MDEESKKLVTKLGLLNDKIQELEAYKQALMIEYNNTIMELWELIPPTRHEHTLQPKVLNKGDDFHKC